MPNFDPVNRRLLEELQRNARQTNRELARLVGTAESTCLERVRLLHADGVITGHHTEVALAAIGRPVQALIAVKLYPKTRATVTEFRDLALTQEQTVAVYAVSGDDDFLVHVAVGDPGELESVVLDLLAAHPAVADLSTTLVYEHLRRWPLLPA